MREPNASICRSPALAIGRTEHRGPKSQFSRTESVGYKALRWRITDLVPHSPGASAKINNRRTRPPPLSGAISPRAAEGGGLPSAIGAGKSANFARLTESVRSSIARGDQSLCQSANGDCVLWSASSVSGMNIAKASE